MLALSADQSGDLLAFCEEVVALKRRVGDVIALSDTLSNVGWSSLLAHDFERAITNLEEALAIARQLGDTFRIALAVSNLGHAALAQERYGDARRLLGEGLVLCIRRGDRRGGQEAVLGLAATAAGAGDDELAVRLDAIRRRVMEETGIVYPQSLLALFEPLLQRAHEKVGVGELDGREPTLELALELLDQSTSIASPNE